MTISSVQVNSLLRSSVFKVDHFPGKSGSQAHARFFLSPKGKNSLKGNISAEIIPWCVVYFSSDIFLAQSFLGKSLMSDHGLLITCVISKILGMLIG